MNKMFKVTIGSLLGLVTLLPTFAAASDHDHFPHKKENIFIPDFAFQLTSKPYCDHVVFSGQLEGGRRNGRANGTVGFSTSDNDLFKISAEFLIQDIKYHFSRGDIKRWMHQYAVGIGYQRALHVCWLPSLEVTGYASHAPSRNPSHHKRGHHILHRHIAGSTAEGATAGLTFIPWCSARLEVEGNYDHVSYQRRHRHDLSASGFGATMRYNQQLFCNWDLDLEGAIRQPFNFWRGAINWHPKSMADQMTLGLFASRTVGMSHLPNNTMAGIQLNYSFGPNCNYSRMKSCSSHTKADASNNKNAKGDAKTNAVKSDDCCRNPCLVAWTSMPAVHLPTVLAIAEQSRERIVKRTPAPTPNASCSPPTTTGIPNFNESAFPWVYDVSGFFSGGPLVFSIDPAVELLLNGDGVTFNPMTGVFTGIGLTSQQFLVTVSAQNSCTRVSTSFLLIP